MFEMSHTERELGIINFDDAMKNVEYPIRKPENDNKHLPILHYRDQKWFFMH